MLALLASLFVVAAGEPAAGPPLIPDAEVPRYLRTAELSEWGNSIRLIEQGMTRAQTGQGIVTSAATPRIGEKPEEVRARGEKMIAEGKALIARAQPSLARLRVLATTRQAEQTKAVALGLDLTQTEWGYSLNLAAIRFQKLARDNAYAQVHLVGAVTVLADGKLAASTPVLDGLRAAWAKVDPKGLAPAPAAGYAFLVNSAEPTPAFAKDWKKPTGAHQVAVAWAEVYQLSADGSVALLVVNLADAYSLRLVGCEVALTTLGPAELPAKPYAGAFTLKDERNFLRRQVGTAEALAAFERDSAPLGAALLRYVNLRNVGLPVPVTGVLAAVVGGDPALPENARAAWKVAAVPLGEDPATKAKPSPLSRAFAVASIPAGAKPVEVGQLLLRIDPPAAVVVAKPAGK
jgi:hypothetical protein